MVHDAARDGFGANAGIYRTARPSYHPDLVARFVEQYGTGSIVELGAGTGIFTRQLVDAGLAVTAVEPVASMRRQLAEQLPDVELLDGTAEAIPLDDATADVVLVAQAFHWFDFASALAEIGRVLRPGGHLVTVWNVRALDRTEWFAAYAAVIERYAGATPRHAQMAWRRAIDADRHFASVDDWGVDNPVVTDVAGFVRRALSTSFIAALPPDEQDEVAAELRSVLDPVAGPLEFPYRGELQAWRWS